MPLPEKPYFTLDEVIARWASFGCDKESLLEYARQDILTFAVFVPDIGPHRTRRETAEAFIERTTSRPLSFMTEEAAAAKKLPLRYLSSEDAVRILSARNGEEVAVNGLFLRAERDRDGGTWHAQAKYFTAVDLRVSRAERDRFEEAHDLRLPGSTSNHGLVRVLRICKEFPRAVATLKDRWGQREKFFEPADEYDMQDLMRMLLRIDFDDIRDEDPVRRHAGGRSRIDFILPEPKIALELKMTREGMADKAVGDQLLQDIERYKSHEFCKTLVCAVYDPEERIRNARELESSLSGARGELEVIVLVVR